MHYYEPQREPSKIAVFVFLAFIVLMFLGVFRGNNDEYYGGGSPTPQTNVIWVSEV